MSEKEEAVWQLFSNMNLTIIRVLVDIGYIDKDMFMKNVSAVFDRGDVNKSYCRDLFDCIDETWGFDIDADKETISGFLENILDQPDSTNIERYRLLVDLGGCIRATHKLARLPLEAIIYYVDRRTFKLTEGFIRCAIMTNDDENVAEWTMNLWDESDVDVNDHLCAAILQHTYFYKYSLFARVLQKLRNHCAIDLAIFDLMCRVPKNLEHIVTHTLGLAIHGTLLSFMNALLDGNVDAEAINERLKGPTYIHNLTIKERCRKFVEDVSAIC